MSINPNVARGVLPADVTSLFDDIVEQRVLGASNHIQMIGQMIESIALEGKKQQRTISEIISDIQVITDYFKATRGAASQAINNAILIMTKDITTWNGDLDLVIEKIIDSKNSYLQYNQQAVDKVIEYASSHLEEMNNILVYDYSSTVDKLLKVLGKFDKQYTIFISESRVIDGGYPFVKTCQESGHKIKFFPDAALMYYLKECDVALMGAETFLADGTGFNTTGSDLVGVICDYYKIPLYFLTPLIKLDIRSIYGHHKKLQINDLTKKLTVAWADSYLAKDIDFKTPELLGVPAEHITGFITEQGIIPANQIYGISLQFYQSLGGKYNGWTI